MPECEILFTKYWCVSLARHDRNFPSDGEKNQEGGDNQEKTSTLSFVLVDC